MGEQRNAGRRTGLPEHVGALQGGRRLLPREGTLL